MEHNETDEQRAARYVNGLNFSIQDEISMHRTLTIEDAYQMALRVEEKLKRVKRGGKKGSTPSSN